MIDLHSHILPGIDDGCADIAESLAFARATAADGVRGIIATPHSAEVLEQGLTTAVLQGRVAHLNSLLNSEGISLEVYPGCEVFAEPDSPGKLKDGRLTTLNLGRYVLLEPPMQGLPLYFDLLIFELQTAGFIPILAHPERNSDVLAQPEKLLTWIQRGAMAQVTSASLLGGFGRQVQQVARRMVKQRWVQILSSDAHGADVRSPQTRLARAEVVALIGEEGAQLMTVDVPTGVLQNEFTRFPPPEETVQARSFFGRIFRSRDG